MAQDAAPPVSVREWSDVVRRARLGRTTKHVAWTLATYADFRAGDRIFPGLATLAVVAEVSYKTAKTAVAELLRVGLIEPVAKRPGAKGQGTEYRLILSSSLLDNLDVWSPERVRQEAERIGVAQRRSARTGNPLPRPPGQGQGTADPVLGEGQGTAYPVLVDNPPTPVDEGQGTGDPVLPEGRGTARPKDGERHAAITPIEQPTSSTSHPSEDPRTAVTHPEGPGAANEPAIEVGNEEDRPNLMLIDGGAESISDIAASLFPAAVPDRKPTRSGFGFCTRCHANGGQVVIAADPIAGDACEFHLRQEAS